MQPTSPVMKEDIAAPSIPNWLTKKKHKTILRIVIPADKAELNRLSLVAEMHIFKTTNNPIKNCAAINMAVAAAAY